VVDIVGSCELAVAIPDKWAKIGSLFWGEREGSLAKIVESCRGVNNKERGAEKKGRPLESSDWRARRDC
jgi:hypothetical protein